MKTALKISGLVFATAALLASGMTAVSFANTQTEAKRYLSREGHFCVQFPDEPTVSHEAKTSPDGVRIDVRSVMLEKHDGKELYAAIYGELPPTILRTQFQQGVTDLDRVASCSQGFLSSVVVDVNSERTIQLSGVVGKEFIFSRPDGTHGVYRVYVAGGRVYQLIASWKGDASPANQATTFLDSFQFDR